MRTCSVFVRLHGGCYSATCIICTERENSSMIMNESISMPDQYRTLLDCAKSCEKKLSEVYYVFPEMLSFYIRLDEFSSVSVNELEGTRITPIDGKEVYRRCNYVEPSLFDSTLKNSILLSEQYTKFISTERWGNSKGWGQNHNYKADPNVKFVAAISMKPSSSYCLSVDEKTSSYSIWVSVMPYVPNSSIMNVTFYLLSSASSSVIGSLLLDYSNNVSSLPLYILLVFFDTSKKDLIFRIVNTSSFTNDKYEYNLLTAQSSANLKRPSSSTVSFSTHMQPPDRMHSVCFSDESIAFYYGDFREAPPPSTGKETTEAAKTPDSVACGEGIAFDCLGNILYHGRFWENLYHGQGCLQNPLGFTHHEMRAQFDSGAIVGMAEVVDVLTGYVTLRAAMVDYAQQLLSGELFVLRRPVFRGYLKGGVPVAGTVLYANGGKKFVGELKENKAAGVGCLYYNTGGRGECKWCESAPRDDTPGGVFRDGKLEGRGRLYLPDAKNTLVYEGGFVGGKLDGKGELYLKELRKAQMIDPSVMNDCLQLRNVNLDSFDGDVIGMHFKEGLPDLCHSIQPIIEKAPIHSDSPIDSLYNSDTEI